jgi:exodeoxyribonuclease V gamma subunit
MGINLYFSNQLMPLAEKLHRNLSPEGLDENLLKAPVVIVPNMNLSKWLKLTLARQATVFMNVAFEYLETGLWGMIRSLDDRKGLTPRLLRLEDVKILLFYLLMTPNHGARALEPLRQYLYLENGKARSDLEIRCWQLSEEMARLFQEYEYHRSDMIARWLSDAPIDDAMERCQRWLYASVLGLKETLGRSVGRPLYTMAEYARKGPLAAPAGEDRDDLSPSRIHLFGLSQISQFHLRLLSHLRNRFDIHIYSLNPSREYWEDIKTPAEKKWIERKRVRDLKFSQAEWSAGDLFSPVDHALLSAWGKPGRESVRLLCQLTDYDFNVCFPESPKRDTVLAAVRHGLLTLAMHDDSQSVLLQDTSLQIMACPGIRREVETVYNSILYNLETDPELNMTDIAVMVTDMSRYQPVVDSVFNGEPQRITYNLVDANAHTESVFAQAVLAFMALSQGTFSRKEVFDLLRNPCVMQRWDFDAEALSVWIHWADDLGIFHDFENPIRAVGDVPAAGLFSWRQGMERLRLSRIMTTPLSLDGGTRPHFEGLVPYTDIHAGDERLVEKFCTLVTALHAAVATFRKASASAREWRDAFIHMVDGFISIDDGMRGEETVFQSLIGAFDHFLHYDTLMQESPGRPLTADALWAFVRGHLEGITGGRGDYLTHGVTVSALMPMRPIPFKVVYVLGLEEGRFPGRTPDSLLDLRNRKRHIGDISEVERNRYLFLEILISVRERLYLSYVSRDLQKDRDLAPCSVIQQLMRHVEQQVLDGRPFTIRHIPIRADSPHYLAPDAVNDWSDTMVNPGIAQRISCYRRSGLGEVLTDRMAPADRKWMNRYNPDLTLPDPPPKPSSSTPVSLTVGLLRRFLLDPVAVAGRYHLGIAELADATAELAEMEDEPLSSRFPIDYEIRTAPVRNWLTKQLCNSNNVPAAGSIETEFEALYADMTRKSRVPAGAFAVHDRRRLKEAAMGLSETLGPFIDRLQAARQLFSAVTIGTAADDSLETVGRPLQLDAVEIEIPDGPADRLPDRLNLSGGLPWVWQDPDGTWHCLVVTGSRRKSKSPGKHVIGPLLSLMAISASGACHPWHAAERITLHVVYQGHVQAFPYPLDRGLSGDYLSRLIGDLYSPSSLVWLPFETIIQSRELLGFIEEPRVDDDQRRMFFEIMTEHLKTVTDPTVELTGAVVPPDCLDRARRRFRAFLPLPDEK